MSRLGLAGIYIVAACGSGTPPPGASAQTTCEGVVQDCIGGIAMNGTCLQYGQRHQLLDPMNPTYFSATCPGSTVCPDPQGPMNCLTAARQMCQAPQCLLDESTITVLGCVNTCRSDTPPNPNAPFKILSFTFTFTPIAVDANPLRTTPIDSTFGTPVAIDLAGFLDAVTNTPDNLLAFDLATDPPNPAFSPLALLDRPNTFSLSEVPDFVVDTVVADVIGVSLYNTLNGHLTRKKQITIGNATGLEVAPDVNLSDLSAALTISPNQARVVPLGNVSPPSAVALSGTPVDVTMSLSDVWVVDGASVITRLASPAGTMLGQKSLTGTPVAIGGGKAVDTIPFPGAIVVLMKTATGGEIQLFLGGALNTTPIAVPLTTDFPNASPVAMKAISIGDTQYAWVALLTGMNNTVALFDLSEKKHLPAFDMHLGTQEPLAVAVGLADQPNGDPDTIGVSQTAFLHVLVKTN
jgi:hypothetical protein